MMLFTWPLEAKSALARPQSRSMEEQPVEVRVPLVRAHAAGVVRVQLVPKRYEVVVRYALNNQLIANWQGHVLLRPLRRCKGIVEVTALPLGEFQGKHAFKLEEVEKL